MTIKAGAAPAEDLAWQVGDFIVSHNGRQLKVSHSSAAGRLLWETSEDGNFLATEEANSTIRDFGTPQGSFSIHDEILATYDRPSIEEIAASENRVDVCGRLQGPTGSAGYTLRFSAVSPMQLAFSIATDPSVIINRIRLRLASVPEEGIFGFGMQLTYFNQKGRLLPIVVQEHGVGRGELLTTQAVNLLADGGGGSPVSTESPVPQFMTSLLRSMFLENTEYSEFDMRHVGEIGVKVWSATMNGRIVFGETPLDIISSHTEFSGRMRRLPEWIDSGAIISVQGGMEAVRKKLAALK